MPDGLWKLEEAWWLRGAAEAARHMAPNCIMVFPEGLLQGQEIIDGLAQATRWDGVTMTDRRVAESDDVVVLAYRAEALRTGTPPRRVLCSSAWVRLGGWRLIAHQQTLA
ncbi:nuclear transport factor 2 family protein [Paracoccus sp. S1E-3]|uniref:nuclear transport factor 2 family protein n=1 Tax=Paracoccus sp. S1E-3 TaxID=2756130 RepID=UPI0015EE4BE9|nr:nuclear transport factor 2 family protein [Paracoccus sp. S1E-3]MBA4492671.1 nuclear transport factor 2 family protein [Paracoccus sp. S1E-3]